MAVQGVNPYAFNQYQSYAGYADLSSMYGYDIMAGQGFGNLPMCAPGMGIPFAGGYNSQQYYDYMRDNLHFTSNYQLDYVDHRRNYDMHLNGKGERITNAVALLNEKVVGSEQEQIMAAYNNLKEAVRSMYPDASEEDISARAKTYYTQLTGKSLTGDVREYGSNSLWQGFKQGLGLGIFADRKTAEENIAEITGSKVSRSQKAQKAIGKGIGSATTGAAAGALAGAIIGSAGFPVVGTLIGAGIGLVYGLVTSGVKRDQ